MGLARQQEPSLVEAISSALTGRVEIPGADSAKPPRAMEKPQKSGDERRKALRHETVPRL